MLLASVVVCTHEPRPHYLRRVVEALAAQTLSRTAYELVIVDNASRQTVSSLLGSRSDARVIREERLGLTSARLAGISAARAGLIVFVDDDNVLDPTYLAEAVAISQRASHIGCFGGSIVPEYETPAPPWVKGRENFLACRAVTRDLYTNVRGIDVATPWGAGLCVRREVALAYRDMCSKDKRRLLLDRQGRNLDSCGDIDLAYTACSIGLAVGVFRSLTLTHLIPSERLTESYFLRWMEGNSRSLVLLAALDGIVPPGRPRWREAISAVRFFARTLRLPDFERRLAQAHRRGMRAGEALVARLSVLRGDVDLKSSEPDDQDRRLSLSA